MRDAQVLVQLRARRPLHLVCLAHFAVGLEQDVVDAVAVGLRAVHVQIAAPDGDDHQPVAVLALPAGDIRKNRLARRAARLGEEQQQRFAQAAKRVERHRDAVQTGEREIRSGAVHREPGRRRRLFQRGAAAKLRLDRLDAQHQATVLGKQLNEHRELERGQHREAYDEDDEH